MNDLDFAYIIKLLPGILLGLTVHEYMHAKVAYLLGDSTARDQGRVTLNPLKHIDPFGFIFLIFAGFGWAKPVQINRQLLKNPRRDEMLISVAGPLSNLVLGILCSVLLKVLITFYSNPDSPYYTNLRSTILYAVFINYGLFIFNMLPIPPLDGSHIFFNAIRIKEETERAIFKYGTIILFAIIIIENQTKIGILPLGRIIKFMVQNTFQLLGIPH
jgi:Zn-dependent protease